MADPTNLPDALAAIAEMEGDRQNLQDLLRNALAADGPHRTKERNRIAFAHGEILRLGRALEVQLRWVAVNVSMGELIPRMTQIMAALNAWDDSPNAKFDDTAIPP